MRDLVVTLLILSTIPFILARPYIGVLVWSWVSYMNPHRLAWGFAYDFPFAMIVALALFASLVFSREPKKFPVDGMIWIWFAFLAWMTITTAFALAGDYAWDYYFRVTKIQLLTFITLMVIRSVQHVNLLIWVIVLSIGFYSVKGGTFTLLTGGSYRVWGPEQTMFGENNQMGTATLMIVPLIFYLRQTVSHRWVRLGLFVAGLLSIASAVGSQSRGALVAIAAFGVYFWILSDKKVVSGLVIAFLAVGIFQFMPASWHERMGTISEDAENESNPRLLAWKYGYNVANERVTGAGFMSYNVRNYADYGVYVQKAFVAHSIYFEVLTDHGWPGLAMFLAILFITWRKLSLIAALARNMQIDKQVSSLLAFSKAFKLSLIAFMSGGAFLSLAYFDLAWHLIAMTHIVYYLAKNDVFGNKEARSFEKRKSAAQSHPEIQRSGAFV